MKILFKNKNSYKKSRNLGQKYVLNKIETFISHLIKPKKLNQNGNYCRKKIQILFKKK